MRSFLAVCVAALAASRVFARTYTTTLPYVDGNTLVIGETTDPLGDVITRTISTVIGTATGAVTAITSPTTSSSSRRVNTRTTAGAVTTTTGQRVVGVDTTAPPMRTTTYYYDPGNGVWTVATWTASVTGPPAVATAIVPEGTIQDYQSYQTVVNSAVLASAEAAAVTGSTGGASRIQEKTAGWAAVAVGVIGAGVGAMIL